MWTRTLDLCGAVEGPKAAAVKSDFMTDRVVQRAVLCCGVLQVAGRTNDSAGDGTTTASVLAREMIHFGLQVRSVGGGALCSACRRVLLSGLGSSVCAAGQYSLHLPCSAMVLRWLVMRSAERWCKWCGFCECKIPNMFVCPACLVLQCAFAPAVCDCCCQSHCRNMKMHANLSVMYVCCCPRSV